MLTLILGYVLLGPQDKFADANEPAWQVALEKRHEFLVKKNGPGTDPALAAQLVEMAKEDQAVRIPMTQLSQKDWTKAMIDNINNTDLRLTATLKKIVAKKGWPTIRLVGFSASEDAALIVVHTADHNFQKAWIPKLQKLADNDQIAGSSIALMIDKTLVADKKPQLFGSQFDIKGTKAIQFPVEDPAHLDERRLKYMLPPMAEYKKILLQMYKLTD